ncbi:hypothetical protein [Paenisporosarcina sp.]|jgi:hypothetical protein
MKNKLFTLILVAAFLVGVAQPSQTHAKDMLPEITNIKPINGTQVALSK